MVKGDRHVNLKKMCSAHVRRLMGIKRVDKRTMDEMRVEVAVEESFTKTWEMNIGQREQMPRKRRGKRRRGRPKLRSGSA